MDGDSIIVALTLPAQLRDEIDLITSGADESEALEALSDLVRKNFHGV